MINVAEPLQRQIRAVNAAPLLEKLGERSPHTLAHSKRLADVALRLGVHVNYAFAALMHDNGKIDAEVLSLIESSRTLTPEEKEVVQRHTAYGGQNIWDLNASPETTEMLDIARFVANHHHDKPSELARMAAEFPELRHNIEATQFVQLLDVYDAMQDPNRPYRDPAPEPEAASEALKGMVFPKVLGRKPGHILSRIYKYDLLNHDQSDAA